MIDELLLIFCSVAILFYCYAIYVATQFFLHSIEIDPNFHPPISILKPVCGLDTDAYTNLASFCQQNYPEYQIIFGVRDRTDPIIAVINQIRNDFPTRDIQLIINDRIIGSNLKVSNLANIEPFTKYELLLVADSDIRVGSDYLQHIVQPMQIPNTGVVTCLYRSRVYQAIAALEAITISTDFHPSVLVARGLGWMKFAMGSSILIRRSVLEKIGGFPAIADYLADDFMLGHLPTQAGYKVVLSNYVVEHTLETKNLLDFIQHQNRWNCCTRTSNFSGYLGLIFTQGTTMSLLLLFLTQGSGLGWCMLLITWTARLAMGWVVGSKYLRDTVAQQFLWLVPLRDLLSFGLWFYGLWGDRIIWRGQPFKLTKTGKLVPLNLLVE